MPRTLNPLPQNFHKTKPPNKLSKFHSRIHSQHRRHAAISSYHARKNEKAATTHQGVCREPRRCCQSPSAAAEWRDWEPARAARGRARRRTRPARRRPYWPRLRSRPPGRSAWDCTCAGSSCRAGPRAVAGGPACRRRRAWWCRCPATWRAWSAPHRGYCCGRGGRAARTSRSREAAGPATRPARRRNRSRRTRIPRRRMRARAGAPAWRGSPWGGGWTLPFWGRSRRRGCCRCPPRCEGAYRVPCSLSSLPCSLGSPLRVWNHTGDGVWCWGLCLFGDICLYSYFFMWAIVCFQIISYCVSLIHPRNW